MKAAVLRQVRTPLQIEDVQINKPGPHEVLIRTAAAGLCHSDLHFIEGSYPHPLPAVLGHESAGVVEAVGSEVRTVKVGNINYKDTAVLRKFISDRGKIRARRVTGVSVQEQRKLAKAIKNAREMALLPYSTTGR